MLNQFTRLLIRSVRDVRLAVEDRAPSADADDGGGAADEQGGLLRGRQRHLPQAGRAGRAQGQALHARHPAHPPAGKSCKIPMNLFNCWTAMETRHNPA